MASSSTTSGTAGKSGTAEWAWWPLKVAGTPWNVSDTMVAWGLWSYYSENDPLTQLYASVVPAANPGGAFISPKKPNKYGYGHAVATPQGLEGKNGTTDGAWEIFCEMCLRTRAILYCESVIGDCGAFVPMGLPSSGAEIGIGLGEKALGAIPIVGGLLSGVLGGVSGLLTGQAHAQAVSNEKQALCSLSSEYSGELQNAYSAFAAGQLSGQQFYNYVKQLASSFAQDVEKIIKSCNAACGMVGIMNAHAALAGYISGVVPLPSGVVIPTQGSGAMQLSGDGSDLGPAQTIVSSVSAVASSAAAELTSVSPWLIIIAILIVVLVVL